MVAGRRVEVAFIAKKYLQCVKEMKNESVSLMNDNQSQPQPTGTSPVRAACRAQLAGANNLAYCLVPNPENCEHILFFGTVIFCFHPDRQAIIDRTRPE
jgi:hypothetical protein